MFESFTASAQTAATTVTPEGAFEGTWVGGLQSWVDGLPEALQWLGVIAISAIPFIESYSGPALGMISGIPWWVA